MKIYVASSWRNPIQPAIVTALRGWGHDVYDFRNPPNRSGFLWHQVDPWWSPGQPRGPGGKEIVDAEKYRKMVDHPIAVAGYEADMAPLRSCDAVVYVLPCGRSASWELGYAMGQGKKAYIVWFGFEEPELMFREAKVLRDMSALFDAFGAAKP